MRNKRVEKIVITSILSVLIVGLAFLPINVGPLSITITIIPIAIGAALYGVGVGTILGLVFGLTSFFQCFGYSPFGAGLLSINPFYTFILCVPTRILVGLIPALVHKGLGRNPKIKHFNDALTCLLVPLLNTLFFMSALVMLFYHTDFIQDFVQALSAKNAIMFVIYFVGINGLVEFLVGAFISFPLLKTLSVALRK